MLDFLKRQSTSVIENYIRDKNLHQIPKLAFLVWSKASNSSFEMGLALPDVGNCPLSRSPAGGMGPQFCVFHQPLRLWDQWILSSFLAFLGTFLCVLMNPPGRQIVAGWKADFSAP